MKEYRYITFKPIKNLGISEEEYNKIKKTLEEMQYEGKGFPLSSCEEIEKYVDFEKSILIINITLDDLKNGINEKYKKQIYNLSIGVNEIEDTDVIQGEYKITYINGCKLEEFSKRKNLYFKALAELKNVKNFDESFGRERLLRELFNSLIDPNIDEKTVIEYARKKVNLTEINATLPCRKDMDQCEEYEWIMYHDFSSLLPEEIETLTKGKIIQETLNRMIIMLDKVDKEEIEKIVEVCRGRKQLVIKLLPSDINKLLALKINLNIDEFNVEYSCNTVAQAPIELMKQLGISHVLIGAAENPNVQPMTIDAYEEIYNKLIDITKGISKDTSEYKMVKKIYKRLGKILSYDEEQDSRERNGKIEFDDNFYKCRNLEHGLLNGKCVCVGYSEILKQVLSLVEIECNICSSEITEDGECHSYNQIKVDGVWYNADLTWDCENIKRNKKMQYFLKSDKDFRKVSQKEDECLHYSIDYGTKVCNISCKPHKKIWEDIVNRIFRPKNKLTEQVQNIPEKNRISDFRKRYTEKIDITLININDRKKVSKDETQR